MFEEKNKEPLLSTHMQDIISRSIDGKTDANSDEIFRYKYKIMNMLTANEDILNALHYSEAPAVSGNGDLYRNVCIFDFMKLPEHQNEVMNYICFEINDRGSYDGLTNKTITFRAVSHEKDCKTDWSISRQDLLALIIKTEFDWTNAFGMHFEKESDIGYVSNNGFYYREIVYKVSSPNNVFNKINLGKSKYG